MLIISNLLIWFVLIIQNLLEIYNTKCQNPQRQEVLKQMYYNPAIIPSNYSNYNNLVSSSNMIKSGQVVISNRGLEHLNCILPQQGNMGGLYLGDIISTIKTQLLQKHQIKSILSCMTEPIPSSEFLKYITSHKILPIRDSLQFTVLPYFKQSQQFIHQSRLKGHNVLVHCHAGVSRSAAIVCAYLMCENLWDFERTISFIRDRRYRAKPNANFIQQLITYYNEHVLLKGKNLGQIKTTTMNEQKYTKQFKITLEEQTQIHSELLSIEQRKHQPKRQPSTSFIYQKPSVQINLFNNNRRSIFHNSHHGSFNNQQQSILNPVINSKLKTGRLQDIKRNDTVKNGYLKGAVTPKARLYDQSRNNVANTNHIRSQSGSFMFPHNATINTPNKQKFSLSNIKKPHIQFHTPTHKVESQIHEQVLAPDLYSSQKPTSNRFSLRGNLTTYKQHY